jgi:hypothetical protein
MRQTRPRKKEMLFLRVARSVLSRAQEVALRFAAESSAAEKVA